MCWNIHKRKNTNKFKLNYPMSSELDISYTSISDTDYNHINID